MANLEVRSVIHATPEQVWAYAQHYSRRGSWDQFSTQLIYHAGREQSAPGDLVTVKSYHGLAMTVRYLSCSPPNVAAIEMVSGPFFLAKFAGSWRFRALPDGQTEAIFRYHLAARPALRWLEGLMVWVFRRDSQRRLLKLKQVCETAHQQAR